MPLPTLVTNAAITKQGVDALRRRIGVPLRLHPHNGQVTRDAIQRFTRGVGDGNPLWTDETYATHTHHAINPAPPMFLYSVVCPSGDLAGGLPGVHSFHGGNDWEFYRVAHLGDRITATATLTDVVEKQSSYAGRSVIQYVDVVYKDQEGEVVAKARGWSVRTERDAARQRGRYAGLPSDKYTPEKLRAIEEEMDHEEIQGNKIRYWEDVKEGDSLGTVVKGPLGLEDVETFVAHVHGAMAMGRHAAYLQRHPAWVYRDPETNYYEPWSQVNFLASAAQAVGIPRPYALGSQRVCWLGHLLTNWMGDDGFLAKLSVTMTRPTMHGDTQWCKGTVTRKRVENGQHLVDCDVWSEGQSGEATTKGTAVIRLLSTSVQLWGVAAGKS